MGADEDRVADYVVQLGGGNPTNVTHNNFTVPDWGTLRFDLRTGDVPATSTDVPATSTDRLRVTLEATDGSGISTQIKLEEAIADAPNYLEDTRRIGYGEIGFETFTLDVPDNLRGKQTILKFELVGGGTIYLDDVFFKSQHLLFGNPKKLIASSIDPNDSDGNIRQESRKPNNAGSYANNYLIEKPQYAVSYNNQTKNPNWVSWQLNPSWVAQGDNGVSRSSLRQTSFPPNYPPNTDYSPRPGDPWQSDPELPNADFPVRVEISDLNNAVNNGTLQRGHLTAFRDRDRNAKDAIATFVTTNMIPQSRTNNTLNSAWEKFETYLDNTLVAQGRNLYVIAGGYYNPNQTRQVINNTIIDSNEEFVLDGNERITTGIRADLQPGQSINPRTNPKQISVPDFTWKIVVVPQPGQQLTDIDSNTQAIAIITPNREAPNSNSGSIQLPNQPLPIAVNNWSYWLSWRVNVDYLETITGFDFLSNLPDDIEQAIESDDSSPLTPPLQAAPLMAGSKIKSFTNGSVPSRIGIGDNSTIGQNGIVAIPTETTTHRLFPNSPLEVSTSHIGFQSVTTCESRSSEISLNQNGQIEVGSFEIGISENSPLQVGVTEAGFSEVGTFEVDSFKPDFFQFNSSQIDSSEISFSSSVPSQQFFSSHNSTPEIINELNNSATNIWSDLL